MGGDATAGQRGLHRARRPRASSPGARRCPGIVGGRTRGRSSVGRALDWQSRGSWVQVPSPPPNNLPSRCAFSFAESPRCPGERAAPSSGVHLPAEPRVLLAHLDRRPFALAPVDPAVAPPRLFAATPRSRATSAIVRPWSITRAVASRLSSFGSLPTSARRRGLLFGHPWHRSRRPRMERANKAPTSPHVSREQPLDVRRRPRECQTKFTGSNGGGFRDRRWQPTRGGFLPNAESTMSVKYGPNPPVARRRRRGQWQRSRLG